MTSEFLVGFVTCPEGKAREIAQKVVSEKLVACVNIVPAIKSIYHWQDKICEDTEELMIVKTHLDKWSSFESRIKELHPYEIPEIISFPIKSGYQPYLNWIKSSILE